MIMLLISLRSVKTRSGYQDHEQEQEIPKNPPFGSEVQVAFDLKYCLQSLRRPNILPLVNHQPMKRSLVYSITVLLAAGLMSSCATKTETSTTTTAPEKAPAKKETTTKKSTTKKESSTDATKKESTTTKKESTKKSDASPSPSPSPSATP